MLRIYLIRHGETAGNKEGRFRGRTDFPLNKRGLKQAESLANELKDINFSLIYSSPLSRAQKTVEIINKFHNCTVKICEEINNAYLGNWEGQLKIEVKEKFPNLYQLWLENPEKLNVKGMERINQIKKRSGKFIREITRKIDDNEEKSIAVVSHRAVIKPMIADLIGIKSPYFWKIHMETAAYSIVEYTAQRGFLLYQLNQNRHLNDFIVEKE